MNETSARRQDGKPFRIDVHHHIYPPRFMANQAKRNPNGDRRHPPSSSRAGRQSLRSMSWIAPALPWLSRK